MAWPSISYPEWSATCDTLHAHTQVLGKLAAELAPPEPQLQHAALRLTARGWETAPWGSWMIAKRPTGMSIGPKVTSPPLALAVSAAASASGTVK